MTLLRPAVTSVGLAGLLALSGCASTPAPDRAANADASIDATSYPTQLKEACDILTQRVARSILGGVAEQSDPVPESGSSSVRISSCVRISSLSELDRSGAVSLVMRVAHSSAGAGANAEAFEPGALPRAGEEVPGYGEKAFWNPTVGQLNILNEGNWYVLTAGPIDPAKHTLADTKKLADAVLDDL